MLSLLAAVTLAQAPLVLQTLVPTSGTGAEALLDGKPDTGWTPDGDAEGEGVLLRFESPVKVKKLFARACKGTTSRITTFIDGVQGKQVLVTDAPTLVREPGSMTSTFFRFDDAGAGQCLAELSFAADAPLDVRPPRTARATVSASSTLDPIDAYHPAFLFDQSLDTGWVEGAKGLGLGESITATFEAPVTLTALELWNGFQNSPAAYTQNARAKTLKITVDGLEPFTVAVKDAQGPQKLALPKPVTTQKLTLTLVEGVKGTTYEDLVLTELRLWDADGPKRVTVTDVAARAATLRTALEGKPLGTFLDATWRNACDGGASVEAKFRSNHTFVVYSEQDGPNGGSREVLDGTWVARDGKTAELFARRRRTEESYNPYGGPGVTERTGLTGGKLTFTVVASLPKGAWEATRTRLLATPADGTVSCAEAASASKLGANAVLVEGRALTALLKR